MSNKNHILKLPVIDLHACIQGEGKFMGIPHILIRFTGCNLFCQFRDNICDTSYSSWFPEKGTYTINDIEGIAEQNRQIKNTLITGGEPLLYPKEIRDIIRLLKNKDHVISVETNGTLYEELDIDFITISPKLGNSVPKTGSVVLDINNQMHTVTEKQYLKHEKQRIKTEILIKLIKRYDYQFKFVVQDDNDLTEIKELTDKLNIPASKIYLMPEGVTREQLQDKRQWVIEKCIENGFRYSDRLHIVAYGNKREA